MSKLDVIQPVIERDPDRARKRWNIINEHSVARSPFTEWNTLVQLSDVFGWSLRFVFWGETLGVCFLVRSRVLVTDVVVPPFSPYTAILLHSSVPESERAHLLSRVLEPVKGLPGSRTVSFEPRFTSYLPTGKGYAAVSKHTYHVTTGPVSESLPQFSESTRRLFSKSNADYQLETTGVALNDIAQMVVDGYKTHARKPPLQPGALGVLAENTTIATQSFTVGLSNVHTGDLEAGIVFLVSNQMAWYWVAGSKRGPAMTVLLTRSLEFLREQGITTLDFMGANTDGITEFKRRFGGRLVEYTHYTKQNAGNRLVSHIRSFWQ